MVYDRQKHWQFLEDELKAQTEAYKQKLGTSAKYLLLDRGEVFVAQFLKFHDGEMILKFSNNRNLPRKGEYLYCFIVPKELRDYRNWKNKTYGDLIKAKTNYSEIVCIWQAPTDDKAFSIAGFRGVELEFATHISDASNIILILGPNKPPFEYIANLQKLVLNRSNEAINQVLDQDFQSSNWPSILIDQKKKISNFILSQLALQDTLIINGPPGTGKTYLISEICKKLCQDGKSVLVMSLTNRALIEIAAKPPIQNLLHEHRICKTKVTVDEAIEANGLQEIKKIYPVPGKLILSTFFTASGEIPVFSSSSKFDYVIVDEASQALLATFGLAKLLGNKNIWIGDTKQLSPIVLLNNDKIARKNYRPLIDGLKSLSNIDSLPNFQLVLTYRLTKRAANYTGIFYKNSLISKSKEGIRLTYSEMSIYYGKLFNSRGGPTLIKTEMKVGSFSPANALRLIIEIIASLLEVNEKLHISVLTCFVKTTKALQKAIYQTVGYRKNLLVETVARVQGLTTDVTIFLIPNTSYHRSLESRLFNVATSRSKRHTLVIVDNDIFTYSQISNDVKQYLELLNNDFSYSINPSIGHKELGA